MASDSENEWRPSIILAVLLGHDSAFGCLSHSCWFWPNSIWALLIPSWDYLLSMLLISIILHGGDNVISSSSEASVVIFISDHHTLEWPHPHLHFNYICKDPISLWDHIPSSRFRTPTYLFVGCNSRCRSDCPLWQWGVCVLLKPNRQWLH